MLAMKSSKITTVCALCVRVRVDSKFQLQLKKGSLELPRAQVHDPIRFHDDDDDPWCAYYSIVLYVCVSA